MPRKRLRILIARFGEGYENAMLKLAHSCCEAGFEVVYTDLQDPEAIAACALQESVDHIGITTLPGACVKNFKHLFDILSRDGLSHIRVTAGGLFPPEDLEKIKNLGVVDFYPGGSIYDRIEKWREEYGGEAYPENCSKFEKPAS
ncbi:MAG: cobalamin-dependent protein [Syntrophobacteraceae bacterium]